MKEYAYIEADGTKHILGYLEPKLVVGMLDQGGGLQVGQPRRSALIMQSGTNTFVLTVNEGLDVLKQMHEDAKSGKVHKPQPVTPAPVATDKYAEKFPPSKN